MSEQCEVVFPYQGIKKDELSLEKGQVITIISREVKDAGWWRGELNGSVGVFPENFVKLIVEDSGTKGENKLKNSREKNKSKSKSIYLEEKYDLASLRMELGKSAINGMKKNEIEDPSGYMNDLEKGIMMEQSTEMTDETAEVLKFSPVQQPFLVENVRFLQLHHSLIIA